MISVQRDLPARQGIAGGQQTKNDSLTQINLFCEGVPVVYPLSVDDLSTPLGRFAANLRRLRIRAGFERMSVSGVRSSLAVATEFVTECRQPVLFDQRDAILATVATVRGQVNMHRVSGR